MKEADVKMKSFCIIPLTSHVNLCEWIEGTKTIKSVIEPEWKKMYPNDPMKYLS